MNISRSPNVEFFDSLLGFAHPKEVTHVHKRRFVVATLLIWVNVPMHMSFNREIPSMKSNISLMHLL